MQDEKKYLPVQYSDEGYFIEEAALTEHVKRNLDEVRKHAITTSNITGRRMTVAVILMLSMATTVASLAIFGALFSAFIVALFITFQVDSIIKFVEKKPDR